MDYKVQAVQAMQDYIEGHIGENVSLADLAEAAHFSPWHSSRIFKELVGLPPADYIRRLRLSSSALRLRDEDVKVIDVAYDAGFRSVDGYQRAFRREFGTNPKEYAKNPVPIQLFKAYGVKFLPQWKEENNMKEIENVFIQIIDKPAHKVIVKRGLQADDYWAYCEEVGCDVWGILMSMKSLCGEPVCLYLPKKYVKPGTSTYVQGVEVANDYDGPIPEGFDVISFPRQKYLMFQGEPFKEEDYCDAIASVKKSMGKYDPSVIGYAWDDDNPNVQLEPRGERGYIEMRAIKKLEK